MISFKVNDMTCGHCVSTITKAVKVVDKDARLDIDLVNHRVDIEASEADAAQLSDAIKQAGYTPVVIEGVADRPAASAVPVRGGCCS